MIRFLLFLLLLAVSWPLALLAIVLWPLVWLRLDPVPPGRDRVRRGLRAAPRGGHAPVRESWAAVGRSPGHCAANVPQLVVTMAEKARAPVGETEVEPGVTATESTFSGPTATVASADRAGSATLAATT